MRCFQGCSCGCCEGTTAVTPAPIRNRPGLNAISYRVGEHGAFLETMKARLSSSTYPALSGLTVRTGNDPSIALLDSWATIADVLCFYQERIANEGFLRTSTERRSVVELARLIGYTPRPGVAATTFLAYTVDDNATGPVEIAAGARAQSIPLLQNENPQSFETADRLVARREWNAIRPRMERPQTIESIVFGTDQNPGSRLYLAGTATGLKANDALIVTIGARVPTLVRVLSVTPDDAAQRSLVRFAPWGDDDSATPDALTRIRRALVAFNALNPASYPATSLSGGIMRVIGDFLVWLFGAAAATPVDPAISAILDRSRLVGDVLNPFIRLADVVALPVGDVELPHLAQPHVAAIAAIKPELDDDDNGVGDAGPIGAHAAQAAIDLEALFTLGGNASAIDRFDARLAALSRGFVNGLAAPRSVPPRNAQTLARDPAAQFSTHSDVGAQAASALQPMVGLDLTSATARASVTPANPIRVFALRQRAQLFGAGAPQKISSIDPHTGAVTTREWNEGEIISAEDQTHLFLDASNEKILPGSWIVLDLSGANLNLLTRIVPHITGSGFSILRAGQVNPKVGRADYGLAGQTTEIELLDPSNSGAFSWFTDNGDEGDSGDFSLIRRAAVYAQSEELALAKEPVEDDICGGDQLIETDQLLAGLDSGRWLIVTGQRADIPGTDGVVSSELVMLDSVTQYVQTISSRIGGVVGSTTNQKGLQPEPAVLPGDQLHSFLKLAKPLAYCYRRDTVRINANVVRATHGETRNETLGGGDASQTLQNFTLRQPPLTFVPAPTPAGVDSTLHVFVNGVEWHEAPALVALGPNDRGFMTRTNDDSQVSVVFGNGVNGARPPTGTGNIQAVYRNGIGSPGNVLGGQISQLMTRPLGIKAVVNPLPATGGADRETRDQAREAAPLAVKALDRLVSTEDYADFTRVFAGIGKASAARLFVKGAELVHVTIAGAADIPIARTDDLYRNLTEALRRFGDPYQAFQVEIRELLLLILTAGIRIDPDYRWSDVADAVRAALLDRYSFERRSLGQSVPLSQVIATIQSTPGVVYTDVNAFGAVSQIDSNGALRAPQDLAAAMLAVTAAGGRPGNFVTAASSRVVAGVARPAQIAFFVPAVPETLILNQIEGGA